MLEVDRALGDVDYQLQLSWQKKSYRRAGCITSSGFWRVSLYPRSKRT